jgi:hypothetical protein
MFAAAPLSCRTSGRLRACPHPSSCCPLHSLLRITHAEFRRRYRARGAWTLTIAASAYSCAASPRDKGAPLPCCISAVCEAIFGEGGAEQVVFSLEKVVPVLVQC